MEIATNERVVTGEMVRRVMEVQEDVRRLARYVVDGATFKKAFDGVMARLLAIRDEIAAKTGLDVEYVGERLADVVTGPMVDVWKLTSMFDA